MQEVLQADAPEDDESGGPQLRPDQRPCPTCRGGISTGEVFVLGAFEPLPAKVERAAKNGNRLGGPADDDDDAAEEAADDDNEDPTLGGFIVGDDKADDSAESDYEPVNFNGKGKAKAKVKVPKQPNRAVIQDSDDEAEEEDELESDFGEEAKPALTRMAKGKGKPMAGPNLDKKMTAKERKRAEAKWRADQEPSTKMLWVLAEIKRLQEEAPDDKVSGAEVAHGRRDDTTCR